MTTDDFRDKVEKLGFKTYRDNNVISIKFTNDKNLADKVSERSAKAVVLLMDRIHNIKVEKEGVR